LGPVFEAANVDRASHITVVEFWSWQLLGERGYEVPLRARTPPGSDAVHAEPAWLDLFGDTATTSSRARPSSQGPCRQDGQRPRALMTIPDSRDVIRSRTCRSGADLCSSADPALTRR
jgi:hypothetical protein